MNPLVINASLYLRVGQGETSSVPQRHCRHAVGFVRETRGTHLGADLEVVQLQLTLVAQLPADDDAVISDGAQEGDSLVLSADSRRHCYKQIKSLDSAQYCIYTEWHWERNLVHTYHQCHHVSYRLKMGSVQAYGVDYT